MITVKYERPIELVKRGVLVTGSIEFGVNYPAGGESVEPILKRVLRPIAFFLIQTAGVPVLFVYDKVAKKVKVINTQEAQEAEYADGSNLTGIRADFLLIGV